MKNFDAEQYERCKKRAEEQNSKLFDKLYDAMESCQNTMGKAKTKEYIAVAFEIMDVVERI